MMRGWVRAGWSLPALLAASCATLPDTGGYTTATVEVRRATASAGDLVQGEIDAAADTIDDAAAKRSVKDSGTAFAAAWGATLASLDGAVAYAESIQAIVRAGNSGSQSATAVADSVSTLVGTLGGAIGPAGGAVTKSLAFVYGQIANIRAAKSLEASLAAADPAIVRLQQVFPEQVQAARRTYLAAMVTREAAIEKAFGFYASQDRELEAEEKARLGDLADAVLHPTEGAARIAPLKARIAAIRDVRAGLADGLGRYREKMGALAAQRRAGLAVFAATDDAIGAWVAAHSGLTAAIRDRRPVTVASLDAAIADLRLVVQQWRTL